MYTVNLKRLHTLLPLEALAIGNAWEMDAARREARADSAALKEYFETALNVLVGRARDQARRMRDDFAEIFDLRWDEHVDTDLSQVSLQLAMTSLLKLSIDRGIGGIVPAEVAIISLEWLVQNARDQATPHLWLSTIHALDGIYDFVEDKSDQIEREAVALRALSNMRSDERFFP